MLDDFGETAAEFTIGERAKQFRVGEYELRRIKRTDEILPFWKIDARFAADGAVHLRNERRGHVYELYSAQISRGRKTSDIADNASPNCYHQ